MKISDELEIKNRIIEFILWLKKNELDIEIRMNPAADGMDYVYVTISDRKHQKRYAQVVSMMELFLVGIGCAAYIEHVIDYIQDKVEKGMLNDENK